MIQTGRSRMMTWPWLMRGTAPRWEASLWTQSIWAIMATLEFNLEILLQKAPFDGPRSKIKRAERHMADFRLVFRSLNDTDFVRYDLKPNLAASHSFDLILASEFRFPDDLVLTAADTLYNLRSALDQAACRCAMLAGKTPNGTYFPHGSSKSNFETSIKDKCKKVPAQVRSAITTLQPYYGGHSYLLRILHELNLVDKHTDNFIYLAKFGRMVISPSANPFSPTEWVWKSREFGTYPSEDFIVNSDHKIKVAHAIAFSEVELVKDVPVAQVLQQILNLVSHTVTVMEDECARAGLIS